MIHNKYALFSFRLVVGGVFLWAGLLKIMDPLDFAQTIKNYQIFSQGVSFFLALVLPWIEVISGAFLIFSPFRRAGALLISALLVLFLGLIILTMARGIDINCGCFGSFSSKVDFKLLFVDSILLFFALNIFFSKADNLVLFFKSQ